MQASNMYFWGTGRRKNAVARVRIRPGQGLIKVNNRTLEDYLPRFTWQLQALEALKVAGVEGKVDVLVRAHGGGLTGQAGAIRLGIARAILRMNPQARPALKKAGLLTRDPRMVERKKFGQAGARARFQYSKR
ncbi:30S ribosomal protein S9 [Thermanaerovibrio acidaminovorans]|uniref:30S ribosomal protein S9 n=1 Tax=Thermanaerovibrio acidaminovorans TaxID=81462 RepID=UPI003A523453